MTNTSNAARIALFAAVCLGLTLTATPAAAAPSDVSIAAPQVECDALQTTIVRHVAETELVDSHRAVTIAEADVASLRELPIEWVDAEELAEATARLEMTRGRLVEAAAAVRAIR